MTSNIGIDIHDHKGVFMRSPNSIAQTVHKIIRVVWGKLFTGFCNDDILE